MVVLRRWLRSWREISSSQSRNSIHSIHTSRQQNNGNDASLSNRWPSTTIRRGYESEACNIMAIQMENPQDPTYVPLPMRSVECKQSALRHKTKILKMRRKPSRAIIYLRTRLRASNVAALSLTALMSVLLFHRLISLYMSHRRWINAPITYMERQCSHPNYATLLHPEEESGKICLTTLTDSKSSSRYQRFLRWRNFDGILELTWQNKWDYAKKHAYHFFDGSDFIDTSRPPAWSKIKAVQHLLTHEGCDWVMWTDADTVIMNSDRKIEDFLPADPTKDLLVGSDKGGGYNSGVFILRNTAWSHRFLDAWWNMKSFVNPPGLSLSGDNHALKALLRDMGDFDAHVLSPSRCTFNSFAQFLTLSDSVSAMDKLDDQPWYLSEDYYHKGDFLAHSPGYDNKADCIRLLLHEAK
jgi:hypothetical protein